MKQSYSISVLIFFLFLFFGVDAGQFFIETYLEDVRGEKREVCVQEKIWASPEWKQARKETERQASELCVQGIIGA